MAINSLRRSISNPALFNDGDSSVPGPLSPPSDTAWRRERLLAIGQDPSSTDETATLRPQLVHNTSYGTLPDSSRTKKNNSKLSFRRGLASLPGLSLSGLTSRDHSSLPNTPRPGSGALSTFRSRPISAYDKPVGPVSDSTSPEQDERTNGIRVWYSSFTSIDWLHDAIKDSARRVRLRKRRSKRGRLLKQLDRSVGWVVVTLVGFFTACAAFLIVRGEQWLYDIKEGYCGEGWWKAKRFCCPQFNDQLFMSSAEIDVCEPWQTWGDVFGEGFFEYIIYSTLAFAMAVTASLLTIYLTASTTFVTRKDSGVLSDAFAQESDGKPNEPLDIPQPKRKLIYYAAGSGIPEIKCILSGFVIHGYLGARTLFAKGVGLTLAVASGLALGKEGPFVHIGSCIGNIISKFFAKYETNEGKRREVLSAACAAGVAVAFGAPIGGTLFSLEEVSYFFPAKVMWRSFFCAMVAAMTLKFLDPFGSGKLVLFQVTYDKDWHAYELIFFILLGVFGGVWGGYFSKFNYRWSRDVRQKTFLNKHPVLEIFLVIALTTFFAFLNPYNRMSGTELVYRLFAECRPGDTRPSPDPCVVNPSTQALPVMQTIFIAGTVKSLLTLITFGTKVPAGIFIPTLGVGACAGRILGILIQWMQHQYPDSTVFASCRGDLNCVVPGLYAMVGAAATLSGVTRMTVSLAVIVFELTNTLTYVVPIMLAVLIAKTTADAVEPKGIYDLVIGLNQLPYLDAKHDYLWGSHLIQDVIDRNVDVIRVEEPNTVKDLRDKLRVLVNSGNGDSGFPILRAEEEGSRLVGYIGANELEHALTIVAEDADQPVSFRTKAPRGHDTQHPSSTSSVEGGYLHDDDLFDFSPYMDQAPLTVHSNSPLELVQEFFVKLGARYVIVMDMDGYYEGVIDKKTWLAFLETLEATH